MITERQQAVTEALWKTIQMVYTDPEDRSKLPPRIPVREAVGALLTCTAAILSRTAPLDREKIIRDYQPLLERASRGQIIVPERDSIELPN